MTSLLLKATALFVQMTLLCGVAYPLLVTGVAHLAFAHRAGGSLVVDGDGRTRGSALIGQQFERPGYFWGRPSATTPPYHAAASTGSNLGPTNEALTRAARARIEALRNADPQTELVPVDLVTSSGSGLDPHVSPAAAAAQVHRVASARGAREDEVRALVTRYTEGRTFGVLGAPRVNVLLLNIALDERFPLVREVLPASPP